MGYVGKKFFGAPAYFWFSFIFFLKQALGGQ